MGQTKAWIAGLLFLGVILNAYGDLKLFGGTQLTSFVDPAYADRLYSSVVVLAADMSLGERQAAEQRLVEKFRKNRVKAESAMALMPPTRQYSNEDVARIVRETGYQSLLVLSLESQDVVVTYSADSSSGSTYREAVATYIVMLTDLKTGDLVWRAEAKSKGNAWNSFRGRGFKALAKSVSSEVVKKLQEDGLFPKPKQ